MTLPMGKIIRGYEAALNMNHEAAEMVEGRFVTVLGLPEQSDVETARGFLCELEQGVGNGRPYLVLDCSAVRQMDKRTAGLLLHCLEEAMKRNGDVKLAGISPAEQPWIGAFGSKRLFEFFDTVEDAVNSFHQLSLEAAEASESAVA
jgi:anti-sigma B factor antagonist